MEPHCFHPVVFEEPYIKLGVPILVILDGNYRTNYVYAHYSFNNCFLQSKTSFSCVFLLESVCSAMLMSYRWFDLGALTNTELKMSETVRVVTSDDQDQNRVTLFYFIFF